MGAAPAARYAGTPGSEFDLLLEHSGLRAARAGISGNISQNLFPSPISASMLPRRPCNSTWPVNTSLWPMMPQATHNSSSCSGHTPATNRIAIHRRLRTTRGPHSPCPAGVPVSVVETKRARHFARNGRRARADPGYDDVLSGYGRAFQPATTAASRPTKLAKPNGPRGRPVCAPHRRRAERRAMAPATWRR